MPKFKWPKKKTAESLLKKAAKDLLSVHRIPTWPLTAGMGSEPGLPDRIGILPGGQFLAIEFKRPAGISPETGRKIPEGQLSEAQKFIRAVIIAAGGKYIVCRSLDDLYDELELPGRLF
jgi:hypothetical protein